MSFSDKNVVCPFFLEIQGTQYPNAAVLLKCEAPIGVKSLFITLPSAGKKKEYLDKYCCTFAYDQCPVAQMLLQTKYKEGAD